MISAAPNERIFARITTPIVYVLCGYYLANEGKDLRTIQDSLGHRDPKHTVHHTRVAGVRFEGLWHKKRAHHTVGSTHRTEFVFTVRRRMLHERERRTHDAEA